MTYVVLARKWRPQSFSELVGQAPIVKTLQNAIALGRVSHAVLLTGSRGVGKTTTARILAKALNCEKGPTTDPCGICSNCKEIASGSSVDVLEVDGASNTKVDEMRDLLENVQYRPQKSRHKIYIIDEVHMLSTHSFNALLKTLEEPPPGVIFIFATTEPHKIPETILSRCQRFDFRQITDDQIAKHLRKVVETEKITISDEGLLLIARQAAGGLRDALSILDQVVAFSGNQVSDEAVASVLGLTDRALLFKTLQAFFSRDSVQALSLLHEVFKKGFDPKSYVVELLTKVRNLIVLKLGAKNLVQGGDEAELLKTSGQTVDLPEFERWFDLLKSLSSDIGRSEFPMLVAEVTFLRITREPPHLSLSQLLTRLEELEGKIGTSPGVKSQGVEARKTAVAPSVAPENWEALVAQVKRRKPAWAAILLQAAKAEMNEGKIILTYDEGSFYESRAKETDFQLFIIELARELFEGNYTLKIQHQVRDKSTKSPASENRAREKTALENPLVQRAVSLFDARVEEVKPIK